jgi:hypothetical protein
VLLIAAAGFTVYKLEQQADQVGCIEVRQETLRRKNIMDFCVKTGVCTVTAGDVYAFNVASVAEQANCGNVEEE